MNICITYLHRAPRTEPNQAESSQLSRAGPYVSTEPNKDESSPKIIRAKPRDKPSPADRAELRVQPEPRTNPESQIKPELSRIKHRGEQRFEPSRFPNKAGPVPDPESDLEPNRVSSRVPSLECL